MGKLKEYYRLSKIELGKVIFPTKEQVRSAFITVVVVVAVISLFLALVDFIMSSIISYIAWGLKMAHKWYAIQTYAGSESSVKKAIESFIVDHGLEDKISEVIVPTEDLIEIKNGKKIIKERSIYPGYCFAKLDLDTALWHLIQSLPKVSRFIGEAKKPSPLTEKDINLIFDKINKREAPKPKISFDTGETVRITDGPFANFNGIVEEYDMIHGKLRLNVSIFGRSTPVEILYSQVEKIV